MLMMQSMVVTAALVSYDVTDASLPCYAAFEELLGKIASLNLKSLDNSILYAFLFFVPPTAVQRLMVNCNWALR